MDPSARIFYNNLDFSNKHSPTQITGSTDPTRCRRITIQEKICSQAKQNACLHDWDVLPRKWLYGLDKRRKPNE